MRSDGWSIQTISSFNKDIFLCKQLNTFSFIYYLHQLHPNKHLQTPGHSDVILTHRSSLACAVLSHTPATLKPFPYHYLWLYFTNKQAFGDLKKRIFD